ncbi:MAG TPA: hypothetical protein VGD43_07425 [Micromonospora sp.]
MAQASMSHPVSWHLVQKPVARCGSAISACWLITHSAAQRTSADSL